MTTSLSVQQYAANQERYALRRKLMRGLIRSVGFNLFAKVTCSGEENIPAQSPTILMMNHISALDPVICMGAVTSRFVVPMTKIENVQNPILGVMVRWWGAYSINRGEVDRKALQNSIELLKSGQMILIAPEGHRHPEGMAEAKDGMTYIATKADAIILPTALSGGQNFKSSWKRLRRVQVHVNFGRTFRFKTNGRTRIPREELAQMTRESMYQLAIAQQDPALRGVYSDLDQATTETIEFL